MCMKMVTVKKTNTTSNEEDMKTDSQTLLVKMQNGTATLKTQYGSIL